MAKRTAVIDIGSNSARMIIIEKTSRFAFHLLHELKSKVRISENAYQNEGALQEVAIQRALLALKDFVQIADSYNVRKTLCVATSAVRDAPNKKAFLRLVKNEIGLNIKVISGEREAYLGGIACANLLPRSDAMTLDIGGGSTECACIANTKVTASKSINLGTVRLKELFFDNNDLKGAKAYIDEALDGLALQEQSHIIGVGGTFRALAQIIMEKMEHPLDKIHGFSFDAKKMLDLGKKILDAESKSELRELGVKKERLDVIKPGTLILMRFIKKSGAKTLMASGVGVREGLYLSDLLRNNADTFPANFNPSLTYLINQHSHNAQQRNLRVKLSKKLFELLAPQLKLKSEDQKCLLIAAKLAKIGASHHFYSYPNHSHYLTLSALEYGYSHEEIALIAMLVLHQEGKKVKRSYLGTFEPLLPPLERLKKLTYILGLSDALLAHHPSKIDFELDATEDALIVTANKATAYLAKERVSSLGESILGVVFIDTRK